MRAEQTWLLRAEVETDELTRIGNRRRGSRALAQASARARRSGEEYAMFMMDLDKFKSVNDEFGHEAGDEVLKLFAQAIESVVRGYDVAARWGGEEFLLVCPGTGRDGAQALARRLLEKTPVMCSAALPPERLQTVSIGIAVCENPAIDPMTLLRQADQAMYAAKTTGRNRFVLADAQPR
jgi:two-component system, cell cycle response regulator